MVEVYIDEVYPKVESNLFLVNFQNGYPTDDFGAQQCEILEDTKTGKKQVATEINSILYAGEETEEALGKTFILVRNRKTGKAKVIEVGTTELQPLMASKVASTELETSYVDLGRKFGSKRHKKILEQNEKLKLNESVVKEQLQNVSQNVSAEQLDLSSYNNTDSNDFYIPPMNRDATSVAEVYDPESILTRAQLDQIFTEVDCHQYKENFFPTVKEAFSSYWSKDQIVLAVYASSLLELNNQTMRYIKLKNFVACRESATLDSIIKEKFFTYNRMARMRPLPYKDKALCHAIVMLFLINNFKLDIDSLCHNAKLIERTAFIKISMTGGWPSKQGAKKMAVLKLPLNKAMASIKRKSAAK